MIGSGRRAGAAGRGGFTLVELLVVIGVTGLLIGLLLPALAAVRTRASQTASLSNLRNLGLAMEQYLSDNDRWYPFADGSRAYPWGCEGTTLRFERWAVRGNWPCMLYQQLPWCEAYGVYQSPGSSRSLHDSSSGFPTSYEYSLSFTARPEVWDPEVVATPAMIQAVRATEVRFPSRKVLMWDWEMAYRAGRLEYRGPDLAEVTPMLFPDGHTAALVPAEAREAVRNVLISDDIPRDPGGQRLHNTPHGVRGWDYSTTVQPRSPPWCVPCAAGGPLGWARTPGMAVTPATTARVVRITRHLLFS